MRNSKCATLAVELRGLVVHGYAFYARGAASSTMALKKSDLYSSLWKSCDELRGGMDASQYKDYVLTLLFVKYVSDKYAGRTDRW